MERKTMNSTAIIGLDNGFIQTPKNVITNANLTDAGVRLFQLILDTPSNTKVSLEYSRKLLNWSKNKLANATKNLQENGFLKITQIPKGKGNGYSYNYVISSFGNLKNETELKTSEELEKVIEIEDDLQSTQEVVEAPVGDEKFEEYFSSIGDLIEYHGTGSDFVNELLPFYSIQDVQGMEKVSNKYLKLFYNDELAKVKAPESNEKAFNELKSWLKDEVFNKKNITNLYTYRASNIVAKFLMFKMKFPISRPVDYETEMGDYYENPKD